jgi:hypothetical protein
MPLTRNRRRLLIAALVVVGALVACWMLLGRADQRFVGTWRVGDEGPIFRLEGDGSVVRKGFPADQWWVKGNRFVFHDPSDRWMEEAVERLGYEVSRSLGYNPAGKFQAFDIEHVDDDEFRLRGDDGTTMHFHRVKDQATAGH